MQCVETFVYFVRAHSTPRAIADVIAQPPRHGVIKRTIRGSLARSWSPPLLLHCRRCVLLLLLILGLSADAAGNNRCAVLDSAVCVLAYLWRFQARARRTACVVRCYSLCCYSCGCCDCCECFYVLPPPLLLPV